MTSAVFEYLKNWIYDILGQVEISSGPPEGQTDKRTVSLYLRGIEESRSSGKQRIGKRMQIQLTYLVTTSGSDPHEANNDLTKLVFAAMANNRIEQDLAPLSTEDWLAFGVKPKPSFTFKIPVNADVDVPEAKRVEKPLIIKGSAKLPDRVDLKTS